MQHHEALQLGLAVTWGVFIFAFGAICGSFINVLVYRLPKGLGIVSPPSACPACGTRLTWRENLPVLGWVLLGGRCRFCRSRISPEYPLVELAVGLMFAGMYVLLMMDPGALRTLGMDLSAYRPEWTEAGGTRTWPYFLSLLMLVGTLVAVTLIDARTFTIPLALTWFLTALGLVVHAAHAVWIGGGGAALPRTPHGWTIPLVEGRVASAALLGLVGVGLSALLLRAGLLPQSFRDYEAWEREAEAEREAARERGDAGADAEPADTVGDLLKRTLLLTTPAVILMFAGFFAGLRMGAPMAGMGTGAVAGLVIGAVLRHLVTRGDAHIEPIWVDYPYARREMVREVVFLLPAAAAFGLGWWVGGLGVEPLWYRAVAGAALGYLVGGGVVWAVRILGTLAIGREAMGLGDVHLMAGVGAVLGWIDPLVAFFVAPFLGIGWTVLGGVLGRVLGRSGTTLPYGPHLAAAVLVVVLGKPWIESVLGWIARGPVDLP